MAVTCGGVGRLPKNLVAAGPVAAVAAGPVAAGPVNWSALAAVALAATLCWAGLTLMRARLPLRLSLIAQVLVKHIITSEVLFKLNRAEPLGQLGNHDRVSRSVETVALFSAMASELVKWQGAAFDALGPCPLASRKRKVEEAVLGIAKLQKIIEDVAVDTEEPAPAEDEEDDKIVRLHGLDWEAQTTSALWSDGNWSLQALGDMLDTGAQKKMVLKHVRAVAKETKSSLGPTFALTSSCALSTFRQLGKAIRNRMSSNPRSKGARAIGVLTCPAIHVNEEGWKVAIHQRVSARCHVWSTKGSHVTAVPAWRDEFESTKLGPSRLECRFDTLLALLSVLPWSEVHGPHPNPRFDADSMVAGPKAYLSDEVPVGRFFGLPLGGGIDVYGNGVNWDSVGEWGEQGLPMGTWGIVIAKRCDSS